MTITDRARMNPYVGPRTFRYGETLYGRDSEVLNLFDLLVAERIVLLYSPSGAGKSSLINAALIPVLEREAFAVLPVMRVSARSLETGPIQTANRYVLGAMLSLEEGLPPEQQTPPTTLASMEFASYLNQRAKLNGRSDSEVLIFDQFEEILTIDPTDRAAKEEFFAQVGKALDDTRRWALFAMREDYVPGLDPYRRAIPTRLKTAYRLDLLEERYARLAIQRPAEDAGVAFPDAAAKQLVDDLRRVQVQQINGEVKDQLGIYVEPVQLQVVCHRLWEKLPSDDWEIGEDDVEAIGSVDSALSSYYAERVKTVAEETGVNERIIRDWFEEHLITEQGIRGQVVMGIDQSEGLDNQAIQLLLNAHLLRTESQRGAIWFELAHDRLIDPIRADNTEWRREHLNVLQHQAALWKSHGRPSALLLHHEVLREAETWAAAHSGELTTDERTFLDTSIQSRQSQRRRVTAMVVIPAIILVLAGLLVFSWKQTSDKNAANELADVQRAISLGQRALAFQNERLDTALLLNLEANRIVDEPVPEIRANLLAGLTSASSSQVWAFMRGHNAAVQSVAVSPNGQILASADEDGQIILWSTGTGRWLAPPLAGPEEGINDLAFNSEGNVLAAAGHDGSITFWDVNTFTMLGSPLDAGSGSVTSIAFDPIDANVLASGSTDGTIRLWDVANHESMNLPFGSHGGSVSDVQFALDGVLASAGADGQVLLWDADSGEQQGELVPDEATVFLSLAISADGSTLAAGDDDGKVHMWDIPSREPRGDPLTRHTSDESSILYSPDVLSLAFSPDGTMLASGGTHRSIVNWDVSESRPRATSLSGYIDATNGLAFVNDFTLAAGNQDGTVILWKTIATSPIAEPLYSSFGTSFYADSVVFSEDGETLVAANEFGRLEVWDIGARSRAQNLTSGEFKSEIQIDPPSDAFWWTTTLSHGGEILALGSCLSGTASSTSHGTIQLWDVDANEPIGEPLAHQSCMTSLAFSPDDQRLASGELDGTILVWDLASRTPTNLPPCGQRAQVTSITFDPSDGSILASANTNGEITFSDLDSGEVMCGSVTHDDEVWALSFSPEGTILASGGLDGNVIIWDAKTGQSIGAPLTGHRGSVLDVAFTQPDGSTLASGGSDGEVIFWDVQSHLPIAPPLYSSIDDVKSLAFSPNGQLLAVGGSAIEPLYTPLLLWNLDYATWEDRACLLTGRTLSPEERSRFLEGEQDRLTCPYGLLNEASTQALLGHGDAATKGFDAATEEALKTDDVDFNNAVCWTGSLDGFAEYVLPACDRAIELDPSDGNSFDSRGLALALVGRYEEAKRDFETAIDWMREMGIGNHLIERREEWIATLESGRNPFDDAILRELRGEFAELEVEPATEP